MRRAFAAVAILSLMTACSGDEPKPLNEAGERLYALRGVLVSHNEPDNKVRIDHEAIPGFMEAMTMDFPVRGADVETLPAERTQVEAVLHVTDRAYWVTDVKPIQ